MAVFPTDGTLHMRLADAEPVFACDGCTVTYHRTVTPPDEELPEGGVTRAQEQGMQDCRRRGVRAKDRSRRQGVSEEVRHEGRWHRRAQDMGGARILVQGVAVPASAEPMGWEWRVGCLMRFDPPRMEERWC